MLSFSSYQRFTHPHGLRIFWLILASLVCLSISIFLAAHYYGNVENRQFPTPRQLNAAHIESWMTIPYIARLYHVPLESLYLAAGADPAADRTLSIHAIAKKYDQNSNIILQAVRLAALNHSPASFSTSPASLKP